MDLGILVTGLAAWAAFLFGRGVWLRHLLLLSWSVALIEWLAVAWMPTVVLTNALMDLAIAGMALARVTHDPARVDAKLVGGISMALMPAHWVVSATQGRIVWPLYAVACNAGFVLQCLIVGGWLDGLGRRSVRIFSRLHPVRLLRRREG